MKRWRIGERTKSRFDRWLRDYPRATPVGIFLFLLLLVGGSAWSVELAARRAGHAAAEVQAREIAGAIERQAAANSAYLQATTALFTSVETVSPDLFREFVDRLRLAYDMTGVVGLGWSETLTGADVPALRNRMIVKGYRDFAIYPDRGDRGTELHVITMLEPQTVPNRRAVGFNMFSEARRRAAMDRARRTNAMAASDPVRLVQDGGARHSPGFLVFVPVSGQGHDGRFRGYVYAPVRTRDFILAAVKSGLPATGVVELFDTTDTGQERIFSSGVAEVALAAPVERQLAVFDQQWLVRFHPVAGGSLSLLTLVVLIGGVSFALLLLAYILLVQRRNEDLEALVAGQAEREAERAAFVRELNHRVKNSLSNVTSIISLTKRNATDVDSFADNLLERVRALAASHSLLDGAQWGPTDLKALVETQLRAHDHAAGRISAHGPSVLISPNDALSIGLTLHELLTNAARYGALSNGTGTVLIRWTISTPDLVSVRWEELGGPPATAPARRGFGLNLIERALAQELGSPIAIQFLPEGLRCQFAIPLRKPRSFRLRNAGEPVS